MAADPHQRRMEAYLLLRYRRDPDPRLREQIVEAYQPLARSLAQRYYSGGEPLEDLVQIANVGLLKAIEGFDPDRGKAFAAYATPTILGELRHHFRDHAWSVRIPRRLQENCARIAEVSEEMRAEEHRTPTPADVAERCGLGAEEVLEAMVANHSRRTRSLDAPLRSDEGESTSAVEFLDDEEQGFDRAESDLAASTAPLLPRERNVIDLRYRDELTQREVGDEMGISQMQVSRLQRSALLKLLSAVRGNGEGPDELMGRIADTQGSTAVAE